MTDAPTDIPTAKPADAATDASPPAEKSEKPTAKRAAAKKTAAKKTAAKKAPAKKAAAKKTAAKKTAAKKAPAKKTAAKKTTAKKTTSRAKAKTEAEPTSEQLELTTELAADSAVDDVAAPGAATAVLFRAPVVPAEEPVAEEDDETVDETDGDTAETDGDTAETDGDTAETDGETAEAPELEADTVEDEAPEAEAAPEPEADAAETDAAETEGGDEDDEESGSGSGNARRRRRRGGRRRRKPAAGADGEEAEGGESAGDNDDTDGAETADGDAATADSDDAEDGEGTSGAGGSSSSRRRRRRRRAGEGGEGEGDDPENTVTRVRKPRSSDDEITSISGSTRLEAKKQRRREGREAGRRRAPIVSEAEFLARRESVERVMAVRQRKDLTQIAVLEDKVLVEHYVARESQTSLIGNVYLGRVQNVLPSMEAAFVDIGKGRNAVLYAGEVNWSALGHKDGEPRKIESVLQSGQTVLVQVTKDPIGHKGARLTSQVSLAGRFLVYVPDGTTSGISRKLPDTERSRLKTLLKEIVPDTAGVIVRTAAEGASEDELTRDVERLKARWEDIEGKVAKGNAPQLLYGEPDLTLKVVRDLFTEDFAKLVVQGDDAWSTVQEYVDQVAPDLAERLEHHEAGDGVADLFATYRIDEQIAKGLDRKVWLPSGGSLIIDRTEAMTVVDVNTGKFTGSGGNLEETVTKNNLEAAEEIVRQLRLRDIGGIIVVDFIDMVLESNRDLVLRRMVECLGRDRTRHQVAEVTSLGLVQMTRKRIGTGLLEAFSETCTHCQGRGILVHDLPVEPKRGGGEPEESRRGSRRRKGKGANQAEPATETPKAVPSPKDIAAMAKPAGDEREHAEDEQPVEPVVAEAVEAVEARETVPVEATPTEPEPQPEPQAQQPEPEPEPEPEAQQPEPEPEPEPAPVATTTVVTRTRRRAATRPAGPPADATPEPTAADPVAEPAEEPAADPTEEPHVEHVPIKRKGGSRKR
ncbi:Rne/Rng family ribonuclease [Nocardioides sp. LHD-245]|uniref:Rne/Rng family ribonuclease n=1 Tax=Nocardioides sp. LHD-245 TaxID=3051387 RepID=UPI0027DF73BE|nr:Rne/Rng family ribonuclease [Nocardioides sp. LHD-245]